MTPEAAGEEAGRDLIGSDLGRFHDLQALGAGGMGVVYRATESTLKRPVALKLLPPALASDPEPLARFAREAEAVAALNHPNIVTIYSVEEIGGHRFIAMELVEGRSLDQIIPADGLPIDEFLDIAVPLADALSAAHERQIVHRDLKPANIMRNSSGVVKVLDFGLAKLFADPSEGAGDDDETALAPPALTQAGTVAGTPGYMSPEQVRGESVDHRTDLFALGVVLYEMATGKRPFSGNSAMEVGSSVLRDDPSSVTELRRTLPRQLGRIVSQCLEKDPDNRLQSARDLRNQLKSLQKELETDRILERSTAASRPRPAESKRKRPWLWGGAAALGLAVLAVAVWFSRSPATPVEVSATREAPGTAVQATTRPSLAVLPFENLSADEATDWLRTGIPEMLLTSLAESSSLEVLPGRRAHQILAKLDENQTAGPSAETVRQFVEKSKVSTLVRGSFVKLGERYRIDLRIEEAATGQILFSDRVEGVGEAGIFSMIDSLSRGVLLEFDPSDATSGAPKPQIREVTTESLEAFRYYSEGLLLGYQIKRRESLAMFEKAIELDPGFVMALSRIGTIYLNLGDAEKARDYARRAFESSARAPARERFYIQGRYLSLDWATYGQAIDALERAIDQYPDHSLARNILANRLTALGEYRAAIPHLERLVSEDPGYGGNVWLLSSLYAAEGRFEDGQSVISAYQRGNPESWYGDMLAGWHLLRWGKPEQALAALAVADAKRPGTNEIRELRWAAFIQSARWAEAEAEARAQLASDDAYYQWAGNVYLARSELYRGRSRAAAAALAAASEVFVGDGPLAGLSLVWSADLRLLEGDPTAALRDAAAAQVAGRDQWPELEGLFMSALALEQLGRLEDADTAMAELERRADRYPNNVESRQAIHLGALLAHWRDNSENALEDLTRGAALLPPRGLFYMDRHRQLPDHPRLWFSLATTLQESGRADEAALWFERILDGRVESRNDPVRYVRSLFFLAGIREDQGRPEEARELYRRFVDLWGDGDLDRERVAEARSKAR